jgi:sporulation protein YlmC with PRC-barrel domain
VDVIRDVLDKPLLDANGHPVGRVDGIVASWRPGEMPRLAYLEVSGTTLARRVHPRLGLVAGRLARRLSPGGGQAWRIPWSAVRSVATAIHLSVDGKASPALAWERWLADRVIGRIPGA